MLQSKYQYLLIHDSRTQESQPDFPRCGKPEDFLILKKYRNSFAVYFVQDMSRSEEDVAAY